MKKQILPLTVMAIGLFACAQKPVHQTASVSHGTPVVASVSREPDSIDKTETPWTTWSNRGTVGGLAVLKGIRETLLEKNLHDPHINYAGYKQVDCSKQDTNFRSADGTCNDIEHPQVGAAGVAFGRNVPPEYIDMDAKEKFMTPDPALVSKELFTREEFKPVPFLNLLAASWIQFMNHDWVTHGKNMEGNPFRVKDMNGQTMLVEQTADNRTGIEYKKEFGKVHINVVSHWWDGGQIYGNTQDEQNELRTFSKGKLTTVMVNGRELLPKNSRLNIQMNKQNQGHEMTGFRDNWWVGLSMLHHLFVKEHNSIADMLMKKYVTFDQASNTYTWKNGKAVKKMNEKEMDEQVFQTARLINAAVMAKIHTVEWTPAILANKTLKKAMYTNWYGLANPQTWSKYLRKIPGLDKADFLGKFNFGYTVGGIVGDKTNNYGVPYNMTEEFTSVYRLHSLLPENIELRRYNAKDKVQPIAFPDTRNEKSYDLMANYDFKDLFYSFGVQLPGQLVLNNYPKFMQELNIPGHGKMDLGMVDVMRDRERGVPRYNQFRRALNLRPIKKYADFFPANKPLDERQKGIIAKLTKVYGVDENGKDNVEMIDLLVGTLSEEVRPKNFGFGETMFQIFILQASRRLMADRFYTDYYDAKHYTKAGIDWVDGNGTLAKVISRHMPELKPHMKGVETAFNPWKP